MKRRLPRHPELISKIKSWLKMPGNNAAKLASSLGYMSSTTVNQWIRRGRVAEREKENIIRIIEGE